MPELKGLKIDSDFHDFIMCFDHNKKVVGFIAVRKDVYTDFIKILCAFPLRDKKLDYFLSLDSKQKTGFMSKYVMSCARKVGVPNIIIERFSDIKSRRKYFNKYKPTAEETADYLLNGNIKGFMNKHSYVVKDEEYREILSKETQTLCSAVFELYDKLKSQMRERKLERIIQEKEQ